MRQHLFFKPNNTHFQSKREFDEAYRNFYEGEINEEFMLFCAQQAIHALWFNYKHSNKRPTKEEFNNKFKKIVNELLKI